ncbi:aldo/keto reductase [Nonomuraea fuscirosea]|uniref:aldo/keto reductase n=1 Tax=Nonomuraea fuscirosea TaxID=1291556 RepID=UPI00341B3EA6
MRGSPSGHVGLPVLFRKQPFRESNLAACRPPRRARPHSTRPRIALLLSHRIDPEVPLADQVSELKALQEGGKTAHVGLSEVSVDQIEQARAIAPIASVHNLYNLANRTAENVLDYCERHHVAFIPWFPLATGGLAKPGGPIEAVASRLSASPSQLMLAWLLHRSPVVLPIPGTSSVEHLEQNVAVAGLQLTEEDVAELT